jgi:hypothetical protein
MKQIITLSFLIAPILTIYSQTVQPSNVIITPTEISGNADFKTTVKVDTNGDGTPEYSIVVNHQGYFHQPFNPVLVSAAPPAGGAAVYPNIDVWAEDSATPPVQSNHLVERPLEPAGLLAALGTGTKTLPRTVAPAAPPAPPINPTLNEKQPKGTTYNYKVRMANTSFALPVVRFNMLRGNTNFKTGDITLFSSVGFGASMNWGDLTMTSNENSEIIDREFTNNFGIGIGFLYAAGSGEEPKNIFAINPFISILDIQLGVGYELGTVTENQSKFFFTASYSIPLQKLFKGKYYIYTASKGYNSDHPLTGTVTRDSDIYTFK